MRHVADELVLSRFLGQTPHKTDAQRRSPKTLPPPHRHPSPTSSPTAPPDQRQRSRDEEAFTPIPFAARRDGGAADDTPEAWVVQHIREREEVLAQNGRHVGPGRGGTWSANTGEGQAAINVERKEDGIWERGMALVEGGKDFWRDNADMQQDTARVLRAPDALADGRATQDVAPEGDWAVSPCTSAGSRCDGDDEHEEEEEAAAASFAGGVAPAVLLDCRDASPKGSSLVSSSSSPSSDFSSEDSDHRPAAPDTDARRAAGPSHQLTCPTRPLQPEHASGAPEQPLQSRTSSPSKLGALSYTLGLLPHRTPPPSSPGYPCETSRASPVAHPSPPRPADTHAARSTQNRDRAIVGGNSSGKREREVGGSRLAADARVKLQVRV
jgi:hypothetical protein